MRKFAAIKSAAGSAAGTSAVTGAGAGVSETEGFALGYGVAGPNQSNLNRADGSDAAATGTNWVDLANLTDVLGSTYATLPSPNENPVTVAGTSAATTYPTPSVLLQLTYGATSPNVYQLRLRVWTDGQAELLFDWTTPVITTTGQSTVGMNLKTPSGGWTLAKIQALEFQIDPIYLSGTADLKVGRIAIIPVQETGWESAWNFETVFSNSWQLVFTDTFTDTNGTKLVNHTPEVGGPWVNLDYAGDTNWDIVSSRLHSFADSLAMVGTDVGSPNMRLTFDYHRVTGSSNLNVVFRATDWFNRWSFWIDASGVAHLQRYLAGTGTEPFGTSSGWSLDVTHQVEIIASLNDFEIWIDGSLAISGTSSDHNNVTNIGFAGVGTITSWVDNLNVNIEKFNTATVTGVAGWVQETVGSSAGTSTVTGVSGTNTETAGSAAGTSAVNGAAVHVFETVASAAGTSTVDGEGGTTSGPTQGTAEGTSTVTGVAAWNFYADGDAAGTSAVTGVSGTTIETVAAAAGDSTVTGQSAATFETVAAVAGDSTVTGQATWGFESAGTSDGTSTVNGTAQWIHECVGASAGVATVSGASAAIKETVGSSSGSSVGSGVGEFVFDTVGTCIATSTSSADSGAIWYAVGSAVGTSAVLGVSPAIYELEGFRFRNDDGSESSASWKATQDTNISEDRGVTVRLRTVVDVSGDPGPVQLTLQYREVGGADEDWRDV